MPPPSLLSPTSRQSTLLSFEIVFCLLLQESPKGYIPRHPVDAWNPVISMSSVVSNTLRPHGLYSPPGFSVHGILQARILEGVAMPSSRGSSWPRYRTWVSCTGMWIVYHWVRSKTHHGCLKPYIYYFFPDIYMPMLCLVTQLCLTLCGPFNCRPNLHCLQDFSGKNSWVGCHFILQNTCLW